MSKTSPFPVLMGAETEYAVTVIDGDRDEPEGEVGYLLYAASRRYAHVDAADGQGIFMANAGKFYMDAGNHPEWATPECTNPVDLVKYTLVGDRILSQLTAEMAQGGLSKMLVFRGNTGYANQQSWGCHESYLCRQAAESYITNFVPFLVTRILYAGSGGFNPFAAGIAFTISPRSHFLVTVANNDTMNTRPILNLRDESLSSTGVGRLHLVCADSLGSQTGIFLRSGITALVIAMLDAGYRPLVDVNFDDPIGALRLFAADMTLKVTAPTSLGREVTAIEVQRAYLAATRRFLNALPEGEAPQWTATVLAGWETILNLLEEDSPLLDSILDWRIKRALYSDFCESKGIPWESLPHWDHVITHLKRARGKTADQISCPDYRLTDPEFVRSRSRGLTLYLRKHKLDLSRVSDVIALKGQLYELDTRFLQLGDGVFQSLEDAGVLNHEVLHDANAVDQAVEQAPSGSRATLRGHFIHDCSGHSDSTADWTNLTDGRSGKVASLEDPFTEEIEWRDAPLRRQTIRGAYERRQRSLECYLVGDYGLAVRLQRELLELGFEVPSTLCHLARLAMVTDALDEAILYTDRAWEIRDQSLNYILPRIVWLRLAIAMLGRGTFTVDALLPEMRRTMSICGSADWQVGPVLTHLEGKISSQDHALLVALAAAICDRAALSELEGCPQWHAAAS